MAQHDSPSDLTPKHVRAARALLAWSQQDLAKEAGVAASTVADFERGKRTPVPNNAQAIRGALEAAGIRFLATGVAGPAVPSIAPTERPGTPIRWVNSADLAQWADRNDGAFNLPTLLTMLIRATHGPAAQLRFPADEGVRQPGWDGVTLVATGSVYVPQGHAGWEIGSQRTKVPQKAMEDYRKRTSEPHQLDPSTSTFVFVTPRHWAQKDTWAKARQEEGPWHRVRVHDGDDLVHWIEQCPAVGLWLAARLKKRPDGTRELNEVWEEWSLATQWPLTEELVLADRDQDAADLLRWLRGKPSVFSLQATTTEEVVAFFYAALGMLPDDLADSYKARCLVASTAAGARALANAPLGLIIVLTEPEPGLAQVLAERDHFVLQAYDERPLSRGEVRRLARPSREGVANALIDAGIAEPRAKALARDSARNLAVLRRLIPSAPGRLPRWAQEPPPHALLAALLVGGWDENAEGDRARFTDIAGEPYESAIATLTPYVGKLDSPLEKVGSTWCMASPADAWFLLAQHLTADDIARFEAAAYAVLGSLDPRFEMDPNTRWMAAPTQSGYSGLLRHGIGQVLILLALWGDEIRTVPGASRRADAIVEKLLHGAEPQRWWSLSRDFRLLAEASPAAFLSAIEDSLDHTDPPIRALFRREEGMLFEVEHLADLLWALESLAWSPELMSRVSHVLARLDVIDNPRGRYQNRPANSLRSIHLLWIPQTYATLDERLRALDLIRKRESNAAWRLMLGILPHDYDTSTPSPMPRWRDFTVENVEQVNWGLIGRGATAITERLLEDVGVNPTRWVLLIGRLANLAPSPEAAFATLEEAERKMTDQTARMEVWKSLRELLHHHRQFPDAQWAMAAQVLDRLEVIYDRFAPSDPLERTAWLYEQRVALPKPPTEGWEAESRYVDAARQEAARALYSEGGIPAILALARLVDSAGYIGEALYKSGPSPADLDALLKVALRSENSRERALARGLIISMFQDRGEPWAAAVIGEAKEEGWGDTALMTILRALPVQRSTWDEVARAGAAIEEAYWRDVPVFFMNDSEDVIFAIGKLISLGRARDALPLASRGNKVYLPSDLLIEVLRQAARQPFDREAGASETTMFQHYVAEVLLSLDERSDVDKETIGRLEWTYLQVLEHSRRPVKALFTALSEKPELFIMVLSAVYRPSDDSVVVEEELENSEHARALAIQAYRLLELWNRIPGIRDDDTIDAEALNIWLEDARARAKEAGREEVADSRIGHLLSASPVGADGNWPAEPVRDVLDRFRSASMFEGFWIGKRNRRGVTTRLPRDGGNLERQEAAKYRRWQKAIADEHRYTARALDHIAQSYEEDARREDEQAERFDWQ
jgi:transcriptional regulator with XRE-family HTH domain